MTVRKSIIVMGPPGTGKTNFVKRAAKEGTEGLEVNDGLEPGPVAVKSTNIQLGSVEIQVVDTPALEPENVDEISTYLCRNQQDMSIVGVIFMYEMTDVGRLDHTISYSCQRFIQLCGLENMPNAAVVTWSRHTGRHTERRAIELRQTDPFKQVFGNGAVILEFNDSPESATTILQEFMDKPPVTLACQKQLNTETTIQGDPESPETNCCCSWWSWFCK